MTPEHSFQPSPAGAVAVQWGVKCPFCLTHVYWAESPDRQHPQWVGGVPTALGKQALTRHLSECRGEL